MTSPTDTIPPDGPLPIPRYELWRSAAGEILVRHLFRDEQGRRVTQFPVVLVEVNGTRNTLEDGRTVARALAARDNAAFIDKSDKPLPDDPDNKPSFVVSVVLTKTNADGNLSICSSLGVIRAVSEAEATGLAYADAQKQYPDSTISALLVIPLGRVKMPTPVVDDVKNEH